MAAINGSPATAVQYSGINQSGVTIKPDAYYDKLLLKMLRNMDFPYAKYATEKTLPRNFGDTINWRRLNKLSTTIVPLIEGVTPAGQTVSGSEITAVIAQYGNVLYFTDVIDVMQIDKIRQEYTVELGFQAKETLDLLVRNVLVSEGSAFFADAVGSGNATLVALAAGDIPSIDEFRKIVMGMKKAFIGGSRKAKGLYAALVSPEVMAKLFDDTKVQNYMNYGRTNAMFSDGKVVDMFGIRFEEVLNAPTSNETAGAVVAYDSIIIGEEAYAITKLEGAGVKVITKGLGSAGTEDALDQRQSIGWKITGFGAKVLNTSAVVNYWSVPAFEAVTLKAAQGVTITFAVSDADEGFTFTRTTVVLPSSAEYTYADAIAMAGIISPAGAAYKIYSEVTADTAITQTVELTADDSVWVELD